MTSQDSHHSDLNLLLLKSCDRRNLFRKLKSVQNNECWPFTEQKNAILGYHAIKTLQLDIWHSVNSDFWGYKVLDYKSFQWLNGSKETE